MGQTTLDLPSLAIRRKSALDRCALNQGPLMAVRFLAFSCHFRAPAAANGYAYPWEEPNWAGERVGNCRHGPDHAGA